MSDPPYNFSDSFFDTSAVEEPDYENELPGNGSDACSDLDQEEIEQALYGQIHFEANENIESPQTRPKDSDESKLPQPWEAMSLTASPRKTPKLLKKSVSAPALVSNPLSTPRSTSDNVVQSEQSNESSKSKRKSEKKAKKAKKEKDSPKLKSSPKVTVDYEFECESRTAALSKIPHEISKSKLAPLAKFLLRLDESATKRKKKSTAMSDDKPAHKPLPRSSTSSPSRKKDVIVIDSDSDGANPLSAITIGSDSGDDRSESDKSSDDSDSDVSLLNTKLVDHKKGSSSTKDQDDIQLNVIGNKKPQIELDCEKLVDWNDMNLTVADVHKTQAKDGWTIMDRDKFVSGLNFRYYAKSKLQCRNCDERGHLAKECPKPPKKPVCSDCGYQGHKNYRCPNKLCFNCERPGHNRTDCPHARRGPHPCHRCNYYGHLQWECTDHWRQYHMTVKKGPAILSDQDVNTRVYCYNCAEKGHFGHECQEEMMDEYKYAVQPFVCYYDNEPSRAKATNVTPSPHSVKNKGKRKAPQAAHNSARPPKKQKLTDYAANFQAKKAKKANHKNKVEHKYAGNFPRNVSNANTPSGSGDQSISKKKKKKKTKKKNNNNVQPVVEAHYREGGRFDSNRGRKHKVHMTRQQQGKVDGARDPPRKKRNKNQNPYMYKKNTNYVPLWAHALSGKLS